LLGDMQKKEQRFKVKDIVRLVMQVDWLKYHSFEEDENVH